MQRSLGWEADGAKSLNEGQATLHDVHWGLFYEGQSQLELWLAENVQDRICIGHLGYCGKGRVWSWIACHVDGAMHARLPAHVNCMLIVKAYLQSGLPRKSNSKSKSMSKTTH